MTQGLRGYRLPPAQIVSKHRVATHGEVLTGSREVNAMLEFVEQETERIESRFLEPACGNGNFLAEILTRKLAVVEKRYKRSQLEYERYSVLAVCSIYGIDVLEDNVVQCRERLYGIYLAAYEQLFAEKIKESCLATIRFVLDKNIIWGDALTLKTVGEKPGYIVFTEWSPVNGSLLKRREFSFHELLAQESNKDLPLFSDRGDEVFIPTAENEYPPVHFLKLANG
jgi:hypothetical protein